MSVDPLAHTYPSLTPYNGVGNNPVLYIDLDGKDYGVYVNDKDKTITIRATYHTVIGDDKKLLETGISLWNNNNGKMQYLINEGSNIIAYDIVFDLKIKEHESLEQLNESFKTDISGESNKFISTPPNNQTWGSASNEKGYGINLIEVENTPEAIKRNTVAHEIGHTLGIGHWSKGLMLEGDKRKPSEQEITVGNISKILNNVGIGLSIKNEKDIEVEKTPQSPSTNLQGTSTNKNFINGTVNEKQSKN